MGYPHLFLLQLVTLAAENKTDPTQKQPVTVRTGIRPANSMRTEHMILSGVITENKHIYVCSNKDFNSSSWCYITILA
jgi:hypothetical protein